MEAVFSKLIAIRYSPFWSIIVGKGMKNVSLFCVILVFNFFAALFEGVSFGLILMALSALDDKVVSQNSLPSFLQPNSWAFFDGLSSQQTFTLFVILAILFQGLRSGLTYLGQIYTAILNTGIQAATQKRVYEQVLSLSFPCVSRYKIGDLVEYANTPATMMNRLMDALNKLVVSLLTVITLIFMMAWLSWALTLLMLSLFLILAFLQRFIMKKIITNSKKLADYISEFSKHAVQSLYGIRAIFTFNCQKMVERKIHSIIDQIALASQKLNMWNFSILPLNEVLGVSLVGICLIAGPFLLKEGEIPILPLLLTFITITYRLTIRTQALMGSMGEVAFCLGPIFRLKHILTDEDKEFDLKGGKVFHGFSDSIQFQSVGLQYFQEGSYALKNLSFNIPKATTVAIVGSSGAGKSSIVDLLLRLYEPTSGRIVVDGVDLKEYSIESFRSYLGVVSQDTFIFNDTISENIRFGYESASEEEVVQAAKMAKAHDFIINLEHGYHTVVGEKGYRLSGGERQRLSLARAFLRKPQILILDEATSNLDSHSEYFIQKAVEKMHANTTVIVVAHRLSTIVSADEIFVLDGGQLVERGNHQALIQQEGPYASLWKIQASGSSY